MRLASSHSQACLGPLTRLSCPARVSLGPARHAPSCCLASSKRIGVSRFFSGTVLQLQSRQRQRNGRGVQLIRAAIFGVGAPEALLVGVVALVVFGPKGLAQAVKSLGATLRTFSPTIRELASVTNELSSTLQEQIGLDEIRNEFRNPAPTYRSPVQDSTTSEQDTASTSSGSETSETGPDDVDEDLAAKIAASKQLAWAGQVPKPDNAAADVQAVSGQEVTEAAGKLSKDTGKNAAELSIEELEAELERRKAAK